MINIKFPSKRKTYFPVTSQPPSPYKSSNDEVGSLFQEAKRRNDIVKKLHDECPYKVGDICKPRDKEEEKLYGDQISVMHIADSYALLRREKWPEGDNPMIVHARSISSGKTFFCTTNYLVKV